MPHTPIYHERTEEEEKNVQSKSKTPKELKQKLFSPLHRSVGHRGAHAFTVVKEAAHLAEVQRSPQAAASFGCPLLAG